MQDYLETVGVLAIAVLGLLVGKAFSRLKHPYWMSGYLLSLALAVLLILPRFYYPLHFLPLLNTLLAGRARFVVLSIAVTVGLVAPLDRLPYRLEQILVCVLMTVVICWFSVMPFLAPAFLHASHASLRTRINSQGICFQTTDYTCGPAAAVTALAKLGINADEGQLAILSHSSPVIGTLPKCLADALEKKYSDVGLDCTFQLFDSIDQLKDADVTLVVVKDHFLADHCITVLEVDDDCVIVADPVRGKYVISREKFADKWRFSGIAIKHSKNSRI
jgi:predicted double-glycine peptidase